MANWTIEPWSSRHVRTGFTCGKKSLDDFVHLLVKQYEKRGLGRTYVAVRPGEAEIAGYYTLASGSVTYQDLPPLKSKKLPKRPVPVALLGRLAVDQRFQGQGLGNELLRDALVRCLGISSTLGIHAVEVFALDDEAREFYTRYGFTELQDDRLHLYLPVKSIQDLVAE